MRERESDGEKEKKRERDSTKLTITLRSSHTLFSSVFLFFFHNSDQFAILPRLDGPRRWFGMDRHESRWLGHFGNLCLATLPHGLFGRILSRHTLGCGQSRFDSLWNLLWIPIRKSANQSCLCQCWYGTLLCLGVFYATLVSFQTTHYRCACGY